MPAYNRQRVQACRQAASVGDRVPGDEIIYLADLVDSLRRSLEDERESLRIATDAGIKAW